MLSLGVEHQFHVGVINGERIDKDVESGEENGFSMDNIKSVVEFLEHASWPVRPIEQRISTKHDPKSKL